jgi:hypothetical protein
MKKASDFVREYREEISKQKTGRDGNAPREGFKAITNWDRQTERLVRREELFLLAAETGDKDRVREALGKCGLNQMNNLRLFTAHKILTHGGSSKREASSQQAARFMVEYLLELQMAFDEDRIITIRKETERRFSKKARKLKKLDKDPYFPEVDFVSEIYEHVCKSIEECKGDPDSLVALALRALNAVELPPEPPPEPPPAISGKLWLYDDKTRDYVLMDK